MKDSGIDGTNRYFSLPVRIKKIIRETKVDKVIPKIIIKISYLKEPQNKINPDIIIKIKIKNFFIKTPLKGLYQKQVKLTNKQPRKDVGLLKDCLNVYFLQGISEGYFPSPYFNGSIVPLLSM